FFLHATSPSDIYTLSLHDALPICRLSFWLRCSSNRSPAPRRSDTLNAPSWRLGERKTSRASPPLSSTARMSVARTSFPRISSRRSEEHTSELQSRSDLVCRLLLEK